MSAERGRGAAVALAAALALALPACRSAGDQEATSDEPAADSTVLATIDTLAARADVAVVGRVVGRVEGRTAGPDAAPLRFEELLLLVETGLVGAVAGDTIRLEQPAPVGERVVGMALYEEGGRYLLFLRPSRTEAGIHVAVPEGRFRVTRGTLQPMYGGPRAEVLAGVSLQVVVERLGGDR